VPHSTQDIAFFKRWSLHELIWIRIRMRAFRRHLPRGYQMLRSARIVADASTHEVLNFAAIVALASRTLGQHGLGLQVDRGIACCTLKTILGVSPCSLYPH